MKKLALLFAAILLGLLSSQTLFAGGDPKVDLAPLASHALKKYMTHFGSLVAGLEILRLKEKKPDWQSIETTIHELNKLLSDMQKTDTTHAYKEYTDLLATHLANIKKMSEKRNINIYDEFDKLTNTCFQCHAAHRPADFLKPKQNQRLSQSK